MRTRNATKYQTKNFPKAELIVVVVHDDFKGNRIGKTLINELESFFRKNNLDKPYLILTEKSNRVANNLYEKLGAQFIKTYPYHDKLMNEWHKPIF
ncbi:MAG: GNAT family N-acetyltransferase [Pedobacter sp.]